MLYPFFSEAMSVIFGHDELSEYLNISSRFCFKSSGANSMVWHFIAMILQAFDASV